MDEGGEFVVAHSLVFANAVICSGCWYRARSFASSVCGSAPQVASLGSSLLVEKQHHIVWGNKSPIFDFLEEVSDLAI